ncbi:MAG: hypothetical protein ABJH68_05205 [Ilumatobacter sp.]|uniref:cupredoxin domain-containing protein n=1 Tax=Ilumatobacter sp. TaxID=1967498 RepID=UPI00329974C7
MTFARALAAAAVVSLGVVGCGGADGADGPGLTPTEQSGEATYEYTIPLGAGEALDAGTPLEILPAELSTRVGETIRIVNDDDRGHNVGPWFVGANETLNQEFTSPGEFEGVCTVHPSGQLILVVEAA